MLCNQLSMTMVKTPVLKFERGSVAFRYTLNGTLEAWDVFGSRPRQNSREYKIMRNGLSRTTELALRAIWISGWGDRLPHFNHQLRAKSSSSLWRLRRSISVIKSFQHRKRSPFWITTSAACLACSNTSASFTKSASANLGKPA